MRELRETEAVISIVDARGVFYGRIGRLSENRKRAEEDLRARELDARSSLDNMPGFLARPSPDGTPEMFNRSYL